jgi:PPIC-type PPIASE domain
MRRIGQAFLLVALSIGCSMEFSCARRGPRAAARASVIALVGGHPVEYAEFELYLKGQTGEDPVNVSPQVASSLLDQYFEEILLSRAADEIRPPLVGTEAEKRRELINRRARIDSISEDELRHEYEVEEEKGSPEMLRLSQMLFPTREKAESALARLASGVSWLRVSQDLSDAPNAQTGGVLGLLARTDLPHDFEKAIWNLPVGRTSPILAASHGFFFFRVEERLGARNLPFEEARPALRLALAGRRSDAATAEILSEAKKAYPVAVVEDHLPFPYVGTSPRFVEPAP